MSSFQGLFYTLFYVDGTMHGVLIKGDVLISGVSLLRGSTVCHYDRCNVYYTWTCTAYNYSIKYSPAKPVIVCVTHVKLYLIQSLFSFQIPNKDIVVKLSKLFGGS